MTTELLKEGARYPRPGSISCATTVFWCLVPETATDSCRRSRRLGKKR